MTGVFYIVCTLFSVCNAGLSEILKLQKDRCVVALFNVEIESPTVSFFHHFVNEFSNNLTESSIRFREYEPPFVWDDGSNFDLKCGNTCSSKIGIFKKNPPDLKCLFPLPALKHTRIDASYNGMLNADLFSEFLNEHCETFFSARGLLLNDGLFKRELENDVVMTSSSFATLKEVLSKTAKVARCEEVEASEMDDEFFAHRHLLPSKPVIIRGASKHWPATHKWNLDFLKHVVPTNRKVHVKVAPNGTFEGVEPITLWEDHQNFEIPDVVKKQLPHPDVVVVRPAVMNLKFGQFIEHIKKGEMSKYNVSLYLEYSSVREYLEEIQTDVKPLEFIDKLLELDTANVWLSGGDTLGKLHFDPFDNILTMVEGEKEITLFDPHNNSNLYEAHIQEANLKFDKEAKLFHRNGLQDSTSIVMSPFDIQNPDFKKYPNAAFARPLKCKIGKGDALYLPAFWWHEVQSFPSDRRFNLAVNFWYEPFYNKKFPCPHCKLFVNYKYRKLLQKFMTEKRKL